MATELPDPGVTPRIVWAQMLNEAILSREADAASAVATEAGAREAEDNSIRSDMAADIAIAVNALLDGAPGALDTLNELAAALGDDANFAATVTNSLAQKAPLASPTLTGRTTVSSLVEAPAGFVSHDSGGAITFNSATKTVHKVLVNTNITSMTVTNPVDGADLTLMFAPGGGTVTWATDMRFVGGVAPSLPAAGNWLSVTLKYDAILTIWVEQYRSTVPF